ncbi:alpha/beta hydrolase [Streptomyces sp. NPDC127068]|uniref:alpha/beta hydrolase n=1 Tax=Streptomyces sp. NPDC127068 TaxID=3347127 RepID=UPI00365E070C
MSTSNRTNATSRTRRRVLPTLSTLLALSASAAALSAPGAAAAGTPAPASSVKWGVCSKSEPWSPDPSPHAQCGTVKVPLDWSKPQGPKIDLVVARYAATDPGRRIGVLMSNPGGPGASGVEDVMYADDPHEGYAPAMLKRFDMVSFDPRGVGRSQPVHCDDTISSPTPIRPRSAAEFERLRTLNGKLADSCRARTGPLAGHLDTESVARDVDAIRAALGERRISFLGHSYGTLIGERYARLFPGKLRALALDSAMDPDRPDAERYLTEGSATLEGALQRFADWCAKDTTCVLKGQDVKALTAELFARADAGTLRDPGPNGPTRKKIGPDQLADQLTFRAGDYTPETLAEDLSALRTGKGEVHWIPIGNHIEAQLVLCRDYDFRIRDYAHYRAILKRVAKAAPHVRYNSRSLDLVLGCQGWTEPPKPQPAKAKGALPPVLVVNAVHDSATPLPGAQRMARAFPKGKLATWDVAGHWLYGLSDLPEARRAIDAYLTSPKG